MSPCRMGRRQRKPLSKSMVASRAACPSLPHRSRPRRAYRGFPHPCQPHRLGTALTRRGLARLTRIGSRERGAGCGRRWTGRHIHGDTLTPGTGTRREPFGRLRWTPPGSDSWARWLPFCLAHGPLFRVAVFYTPIGLALFLSSKWLIPKIAFTLAGRFGSAARPQRRSDEPGAMDDEKCG